MVKTTSSKRKLNNKAKNQKFMAAKQSKESKGGSSFKKSKASSNPNRPDPSGGKPGS